MKIHTNLHAGKCPTRWVSGTVAESSGGGFYGSIKSDEGTSHYFNQSYTEFCPSGQGVAIGTRVLFAPITEQGSRYGKVGCVTPMSCNSAYQ